MANDVLEPRASPDRSCPGLSRHKAGTRRAGRQEDTRSGSCGESRALGWAPRAGRLWFGEPAYLRV